MKLLFFSLLTYFIFSGCGKLEDLSTLKSRAVPTPTPPSPTNISGLQLWLKTDAVTGLNNNDPLASWSDSSGNANTATSPAGNQPLYITNAINGNPVLRFDGADDFLSIAHTASTAIDDSHTVFVVYKASYTGNTVMLEKGNNAKLMMQPDGAGFHYLRPGTTSLAIQSDIMNGNYNLVTMSLDHTSLIRSIFLNGVLRASSATLNPVDATQIYIGSRGGIWPQAMDLAEIILYDRALSAADQLIVEDYLNSKYDLY